MPYVHTANVWCAWQGDQVLIHVRFSNSSVEHVSVDWHPTYRIAAGGEHATGLTQVQSIDLPPHSTSNALARDTPGTVANGSPIGACIPAFSDVSSG